MDDIHDDHAHHENQDNADDNQEKDPGQRGQAVIPVRPGPFPSNAFRMSEAPGADPVDWASRMVADMPEGYGYNAAKGRIYDLETGKALCGPLRVAFRLCDTAGLNWHIGLEFINHGAQLQEIVLDAGLRRLSQRCWCSPQRLKRHPQSAELTFSIFGPQHRYRADFASIFVRLPRNKRATRPQRLRNSMTTVAQL